MSLVVPPRLEEGQAREARQGGESVNALLDRFLAHHVAFFPVDATFMGLPGGNHRLPPADADAPAREREALDAMLLALEGAAHADTRAERLDARMLRAALLHARAALDHRPRFRQPSWYTGEIAFGLISLLLPTAPADAGDALAARLAAIPRLLAEGIAQLHARPTAPDWCARAQREIAATQRLLAQGLPLHPRWVDALAPSRDAATAALGAFATELATLPPGDPASGRDYLAFLMRDIHGLPWSPEDAVALARDAFMRLGARLEAPAQQAQLAALATETRAPDALPMAYRSWHARAFEAGAGLVTPAQDYTLDFAPQPDWARSAASDLYFLSYRSPPAHAPGSGSVYWTAPALQSIVAIKQTHAVHHGSIGHHTQNARARRADSRLARLAGTDCASGIALLSAGTMVEGWACYATELLAEIDGFYTPAEELALIQGDRRNAACVLADINLHTGKWTLEEMRAFYRDEVGFPAPRIWGETTRNSIFPATRLMYFLGTEQIKTLRREIGGSARDFHDSLLACGHVPIAWAADEMRRAAKTPERPA